SDVAEREQIALVQGGIEAPGGFAVAAVMRPCFHCAYGARRAIAIVDFQPKLIARQLCLHGFQRFGCFTAQYAFTRAVTGQGAPREIVVRRVTDVLPDAWIDVVQVDKAGRQSVARMSGRRSEEEGNKDKGSNAQLKPHVLRESFVTSACWRLQVFGRAAHTTPAQARLALPGPARHERAICS